MPTGRRTTNHALGLALGLLLMIGSALAPGRTAAQGRERDLPPDLVPDSWYGYRSGVLLSNDEYHQIFGPRLFPTRLNDRVGINGSKSCNVGYTSGSPELPGQIGVQWGATPRWIKYTVDLEQFEHRAVAIRFRFHALDEHFNNHEGWFIDDIRITNLKNVPDPLNRPFDHTWINGAETELERNWMLANNSHGEKPGWHATNKRDRSRPFGGSGQWSWWYGNEDTETYEAKGPDGNADPTPGIGDEPPAGQEPGFEDGRCSDAPNYGALMTPVMELGEDPELSFWTLWETEGVMPVLDFKTVDIGIDTDRDGLLDVWEVHGVDVDGDDRTDFRLEDLHPVPPDRNRKDVYVEIDCMSAPDHTDCPVDSEVIDRATKAMAELVPPPNSPRMNPDFSDGIVLHAWVDDTDLPHLPTLGLDDADYDALRRAFFPNWLECCVHYSLWAHATPDGLFPEIPGTITGLGRKPGMEFLVAMGFKHPIVSLPDLSFGYEQTLTFLHELGHNLDLDHGGAESTNHKPHYLSLMNYRYGSGLRPEVEIPGLGGNGDGTCDPGEDCMPQIGFSSWSYGTIVESSLVEAGPGTTAAPSGFGRPLPGVTLDAPDFEFSWTCPPALLPPLVIPGRDKSDRTAFAYFYNNWDCDVDPSSGQEILSLTPVHVDVNHDGELTSLSSEHDVPLLDLVVGDSSGFAASRGGAVPFELPDAARRRSTVDGDRRNPDVRIVTGLIGAGGNPAVRLEANDLPDPRRVSAEVSGLRRVTISGPNVASLDKAYPEAPTTTRATFTIESSDGTPPRLRAELRDVADNVVVIDHPARIDLVPPTASLVALSATGDSLEIVVQDDVAVGATVPRLIDNATLEERTGDARTGFRLRFAATDPGRPIRLVLLVRDLAGNATETSFSSATPSDRDGDGIADPNDVCPDVADPAQVDSDSDGVGDVCPGIAAPDLTGLTRASASAALAAASLRVGAIATAHHPTAPIDQVLAQAPVAGARVPSGRSIDLVVSAGPESVAVPALVGFPRELAEATLLDAGFVVGRIDSVPDRHMPVGLVAAQNPARDTVLPRGSAIALSLSSGPARVAVPELSGLTQAEAEAALAAAGFTVGPITTINHSTVPAGSVVVTNPGAGLVRPQGSPIALILSRGPVFTTMPSLIGLTYVAASDATTVANVFLWSVVYTSHPTVPAGRVFEQIPAPGATVPVQSRVEVRISLGPATTLVTVPRLVGVPESLAFSELSFSQLNLGNFSQEFSTTVAAGLVIRQGLTPGSRVAAGSAVDLVVSLGPSQVANPVVGKSGPDAAQAGEIIRYTIDFANTGNLTASDAVLSDVLPLGTTFLSASDGGTFTFGNRTVTWPLGNVLSGASGQRTVDVVSACATGTMTNTASISVAGLSSLQSNSVATSISAAPAGSIAVSVATEPSRIPLEEGDSIRYAITLRNDGDSDFRGVTMPLSPGSGSTLETVVDAGGGRVAQSSGRSWIWRGRVGPRSSVVVVVTARVEPCLHGSIRGIQLDDILLQTCGPSPGNARELETIPVAHDVSVRLTAPDLFPTVGAASGSVTTEIEQPVREGASFVMAIEVENRTDVGRPNVSVSSVLPTEVVAIGDPPFVSPVDSGASWNPSTRTVAWTGDLAPREIRRIPFEVRVTPGGSCRRSMTLRGRTDGCTSDLVGQTVLMPVPAPHADPHLVGLDSFAGLWRLRPDVDPAPQTLMCTNAEILFGADRAPNGEIFVAGTPSFRFDPERPSLAYLGEEFDSTVTGPGGPQDVAYDGTTVPPSLVFVGDKIWRYRLDDGSVETILDDPDIRPLRNVEIDAEGRILAASDDELIRVDSRAGSLPLPPGSYERVAGNASFSFSTSGFGTRQPDRIVAFDTDPTGTTLALQEASFLRPLSTSNVETTRITSLVRLDPDSGHSLLHEVASASITRSFPPNPPLPASLVPLFPTAGRIEAAASGPAGAYYVASAAPGGIGVLALGPTTTGRRLVADLQTRNTADLVWYTPEPRCSAPNDLAARAKPGKVDLTFTPTPELEYTVLRANAGATDFVEIGRSTDGVYVDFQAVAGASYDYALDTICRDRSRLRSPIVRATVPTGGGRGGSGGGSTEPPEGLPEPRIGLALALGAAALAARASRRTGTSERA